MHRVVFPTSDALIIPTFLGITLLVFTITRFVPGGSGRAHAATGRSRKTSPAAPVAARAQALSDEQIEELKAFYGLDKPMLVAYWDWLQKLAVLDLGSRPVITSRCGDLIKERLPVTAFFGARHLSAELCRLPSCSGWPRPQAQQLLRFP